MSSTSTITIDGHAVTLDPGDERSVSAARRVVEDLIERERQREAGERTQPVTWPTETSPNGAQETPCGSRVDC